MTYNSLTYNGECHFDVTIALWYNLIHATHAHLLPVFWWDIPSVLEASRLQMRVVYWMADQPSGPNSCANSIPGHRIFRDLTAQLRNELLEAMEDMLRFEAVKTLYVFPEGGSYALPFFCTAEPKFSD
jgi:hypothetical protein